MHNQSPPLYPSFASQRNQIEIASGKLVGGGGGICNETVSLNPTWNRERNDVSSFAEHPNPPRFNNILPYIRRCIQKFPDWVDNEKNKHSLRSNTKGYGGETHYADSQNSDTTAPSGTELYHLQFSLQAASPETFGYTLVSWCLGRPRWHGPLLRYKTCRGRQSTMSVRQENR
jgi:hypothetical protein